MFVCYNNKAVNAETISYVDYSNLSPGGSVMVYYTSGKTEVVEGSDAYNLLQRLCASATEGINLKSQRRRWAIHNLLGHPLMQIFSWLGLTELGLKIHDKTVPNPITK